MLKELHGIRLPHIFAYAPRTAQLEIGLAVGFFCGHAGRQIFIDLVGQVRFQLTLKIGVFCATLKESANSHSDPC
jgi:hypothetical protein